MNYRYTFSSLIALITIGLAAWTGFTSYQPYHSAQFDKNKLPDAFMEDVHALILDETGRPSMQIEAPRMTHYAKDDTTKLSNPHLTVYRQSPKPWYITSKHGKAIKGIDKVEFWEDVVVQHPADIKNPATIIKSPTLTVYPATQIAETSDKITMLQPGVVINSIGMHANMKNGNINLLSEARGEYAPGI